MKHFETPQDLIDEMWVLLEGCTPPVGKTTMNWFMRYAAVKGYMANLKAEERAFAREHEATEKEEAI